MSTPGFIANHVQQALDKLITPYKNKPRFAAWCTSFLNGWQELEFALQLYRVSFDVDTCDLPRLTILGKLVGQTPVGTLETFRQLVKARIAVNRTDTSATTLIKIARLLLGGDVWFREGDCAIYIESRAPLPSDVDGAMLALLLRQAKMAGVGLTLLAQNSASPFVLSSDAGDVLLGRGLSDDAGLSGGKLLGDF